MSNWKTCRNILCIRADNMGDMLMSMPAIANLRSAFDCKITVLTSSKASEAAKLCPYIDEVMIFDVPWMKLDDQGKPDQVKQIIQILNEKEFDGCVIFTVYSQNPMPAIMLAYLANIPLRLAYCRENPYALLTDWIPDPEPYDWISHQVERDLALVEHIGAVATNDTIKLTLSPHIWSRILTKSTNIAVPLNGDFLILHPGVSEKKRRYHFDRWVECGKLLLQKFGFPLLITGIENEAEEAAKLAMAIGKGAFSVAGLFNVEEFAGLIDCARLLVSVNTGAVHLASAMQTPVVVLYAESNPQHTPWNVPHKVLPFSIDPAYKSKNKVIEFVDHKHYQCVRSQPSAEEVVEAAVFLLWRIYA